MLLREIIAAFLTEYQGRDCCIVPRVRYWSDTLGHLPVVDMSDEDIEATIDRLAERGKLDNKGQRTRKPLGPGTINRYRAALGSVLKYARRNRRAFGLPRDWRSPLVDVPAEKEPAGRLEYLTAEEVGKLIAVARKAYWKPLPCLILCAFVTGLRRGNLIEMRWRDVDLEAGTITCTRTKSGKAHIATLTPELVAEFKRIGPKQGDRLVFESSKGNNAPHDFRHAYAKALQDAGLPDVTFHALRHSCASHLAKAGANLVQIADTLCHSNLQTTRRYSHLMTADRAKLINQHFAAVCV